MKQVCLTACADTADNKSDEKNSRDLEDFSNIIEKLFNRYLLLDHLILSIINKVHSYYKIWKGNEELFVSFPY